VHNEPLSRRGCGWRQPGVLQTTCVSPPISPCYSHACVLQDALANQAAENAELYHASQAKAAQAHQSSSAAQLQQSDEKIRLELKIGAEAELQASLRLELKQKECDSLVPPPPPPPLPPSLAPFDLSLLISLFILLWQVAVLHKLRRERSESTEAKLEMAKKARPPPN